MKRYYRMKQILISLFIFCVMCCAKAAEKEKSGPSDLVPLRKFEIPILAPGAAPTAEDWNRQNAALIEMQAHCNSLAQAINREREERVKGETIIYENMAVVKNDRKILFKEALTTDKLVWTMVIFSTIGFIVYGKKAYLQTGSGVDMFLEGFIGFTTLAYVSYSAAYLLSRLFTAQDMAPKK
jgi:hypothetical protein